MHSVHQTGALGAGQHVEAVDEHEGAVTGLAAGRHEVAGDLPLGLLLGMERGRSRFGREPERAGDQDRGARMAFAEHVHEAGQRVAVHLGRGIGPIIEHIGLGFDLGDRLGHGRFPQARATEAQIDEIEVQRAPQDGRVAQARVFGTAALRDARPVEDHRPRPGRRRRR